MERSFFDQILYDSEMKLRDEARVALENITSMLDAERDFNVALAAVENFNLCIDRIEDLRIAIERYDVNEVIAAIGNEAYNNVCLESIDEQVHIIYLNLKNFIDELIDRVMIWLSKVMLYFNGTAGKIKLLLTEYANNDIKFNPDDTTPIAAYPAKIFDTRLTALIALAKEPNPTALTLIRKKEYITKATLKNLGWTMDLLIKSAEALLPLLKTRSESWNEVTEVKNKHAELDTIDHDNSIQPAEKIKHLKEHRTEIVNTIRAVNVRIKAITELGKQLLAISELSLVDDGLDFSIKDMHKLRIVV